MTKEEILQQMANDHKDIRPNALIFEAMELYAQQQTAVVERLRREDAANAIAEANDLRKQTEELRKRLEKEDEKALYIKITNERITRLRELLERCEQFIYENYELTIRGKLLADIEKELNPKP